MLPEAFCFQAVSACVRYASVIMYSKFVNMISRRPFVGISPNLWRVSLSNKHCEKHFLTYLWNAWMNSNETYHTYSLPGLHDTGDTLKTMVSKAKVINNIFQKCTFSGCIPVNFLLSKTIYFLLIKVLFCMCFFLCAREAVVILTGMTFVLSVCHGWLVCAVDIPVIFAGFICCSDFFYFCKLDQLFVSRREWQQPGL